MYPYMCMYLKLGTPDLYIDKGGWKLPYLGVATQNSYLNTSTPLLHGSVANVLALDL